MLLHRAQPGVETVLSGERLLEVFRLRAPGARVFSLAGALVPPSPRISVVIPCVTLLMIRPSPLKNGSPRMALNVHEARRHDQAFRVDALASGGVGEESFRSDAGDAIAADAEVAIEPGGAGPIHDTASMNHQIESVRGRRFPRTAGGREYEEGEESDRQSHAGILIHPEIVLIAFRAIEFPHELP